MKDCNSCGKCCIKYSNGALSASAEEIQDWEQYRPDIFAYVRNGNIWISPKNGQLLELCPWLKKLPNQNKYLCDIYEDRPDDCKYYPATLQDMVSDECEMLEIQDLKKPKQAQKDLDRLMADSRFHF